MLRKRCCLAALLLSTLMGPPAALALTPAKTPEGVQKKAVVVTHDAKLYTTPTGDAGKEAEFMQIYFLLDGTEGNRRPVTFGPGSMDAEGWLEAEDFAEWNTLQMIDFAPQTGRKRAEIHSDAGCAQKFGDTGQADGCEPLGTEPQRAGMSPDQYRLLVPVFEGDQGLYQGGFVRVTPGVAPTPTANPDAPSGSRAPTGQRGGYDLVLVVDATASMQRFFRPTTEALRDFLSEVKSASGGELQIPVHTGLLLYRDRKVRNDCSLDYIYRWEVELTEGIEDVASALASAKEATCSSDDVEEAVFDALNRAVLDTPWNEGNFKVVLLVGDAPPHPEGMGDRNPMAFTVGSLVDMREERNVRFLNIKIGPEDTAEFQALALQGNEAQRGQFATVPRTPSRHRESLLAALREEWKLIDARAEVESDPNLRQQVEEGNFPNMPGIEAQDWPVIVANLTAEGEGSAPSFAKGWVPKSIEGKQAVRERIFLGERQARSFVNVVENIALAAEDSTSFIKTIRSSLAQMLSIPPEDVFRNGESLQGMLEKASILPFKTQVLAFTPEEIDSWRPTDFQRLNTTLMEKVDLMREFIQKASNQRLFGNEAHFFVPREIFP